MKRKTPQKQKILYYVENTKKHPTANKVYKEVKKDLPGISKSTVYRILEEFSKEGKIKKLDLDIAHFDATTDTHAHFVCENCDKTRDIEQAEVPSLPKTNHGKVKKAELFYYGICNECQED